MKKKVFLNKMERNFLMGLLSNSEYREIIIASRYLDYFEKNMKVSNFGKMTKLIEILEKYYWSEGFAEEDRPSPKGQLIYQIMSKLICLEEG